MPRRDLLALTPDDLATLANRGLVKRAQRDLAAGLGPASVTELPDGCVEAEWPDLARVRLQPDQAISDAACSCVAVTICRHIVGTVLAYQTATPADALDLHAVTRWDPGEITDETLSGYWTLAVWAGIEKVWQGGVVAELFRGAKPVARLHSTGVTLRFLVPHDARYVQCDCAEETPCRHVLLAVRAFRELAPERDTGLVFPREARVSDSSGMLDECEHLVRSLFVHGLSSLPPTDVRRWEALPLALRRRSMFWPADIAGDFLTARDQYRSHDARFDSADLARLAAELLIRMRAIASGAGTVPQLFLRGSAGGDKSEIGFSRLTGLGCHVAVRRKSVVLSVPMQDVTSGTVVMARREIADTNRVRSFSDLAEAVFAKAITFAALGAGNLLIQGAKRNTNAELNPARARSSFGPQSFEWEKLRGPVLLEDFAELAAHREAQPHPMLRPRRLTEDVHVLPIVRAEAVILDAVSRRLLARLVDSRGECITLIQPFYFRGRTGFAQLQKVLETETLRYVSGVVTVGANGLVIEPSAVVYEKDGHRQILQPWITDQGAHATAAWTDSAGPVDLLAGFLDEITAALGEAALVGLSQIDVPLEKRWRALLRQGEQLGLVRVLAPMRRLVESLESQNGAFSRNAAPAAEAAVELAIVAAYGGGLS